MELTPANTGSCTRLAEEEEKEEETFFGTRNIWPGEIRGGECHLSCIRVVCYLSTSGQEENSFRPHFGREKKLIFGGEQIAELPKNLHEGGEDDGKQ